jgi:hypothetical protein
MKLMKQFLGTLMLLGTCARLMASAGDPPGVHINKCKAVK